MMNEGRGVPLLRVAVYVNVPHVPTSSIQSEKVTTLLTVMSW